MRTRVVALVLAFLLAGAGSTGFLNLPIKLPDTLFFIFSWLLFATTLYLVLGLSKVNVWLVIGLWAALPLIFYCIPYLPILQVFALQFTARCACLLTISLVSASAIQRGELSERFKTLLLVVVSINLTIFLTFIVDGV